MSATGFTVDRRDIDFVLHEQLELTSSLKGYPRFQDFDRSLYDTLLDEAQKLAIEVTAPINREGDRVGAIFDGKGNVTAPPGMKEAYGQLIAGGWLALTAPAEWGGTGMPRSIGMAVSEMFTGANVSFSIYGGLTVAAANLLAHFGPEPYKDVAVRRLYAGTWSGTMCLTEAGAGTAVGDNRTRATATAEEGVYHLEGEKVFISGGDHDLTENILHVVLARTPGAPSGTKGLSIFLCPKFLFTPDGTLGERNGAVVTGIEEKMGIHGSPTCTLTLGTAKPCLAYLMGAEGQGMEIMFHMMNEARIGVGIQGLAGAAAAYNYALAYAKERIQGTDVAEMKDADAPRIPIVRHPDVRRMLMMQRVLVETMRSLLYTAAHRVDRASQMTDPAETEHLRGLLELMTPICKAHCSDVGFEVCRLAVQTFGGYGYVGEYPVEQCLRDQKIFSLYEGTNGVQAMDLLGRKMRKNGGALFMAWLQECNDELDRARGAFPTEVAAMEKARDSLGGAAMHLAGLGMQGNVHGAMLQASPFLSQFGTVVLGLHALWQARVAKTKLDQDPDGPDAAFYKGKMLNVKFYCANVLPQAMALGKGIVSGDDSALDPGLFV
jgi:alkylation response protein AidB-like acyl-CoA dehydrogenase